MGKHRCGHGAGRCYNKSDAPQRTTGGACRPDERKGVAGDMTSLDVNSLI